MVVICNNRSRGKRGVLLDIRKPGKGDWRLESHRRGEKEGGEGGGSRELRLTNLVQRPPKEDVLIIT